MRPVTIDDLTLDPVAWQLELEARRDDMIAYRRARRVELGELMTLDFEDRTTVIWQINRMVGVERITDPEKIAHEVATYNDLVPGYNELTATLLIGIDDAKELRRWKPKLVGINDAVYLEVGGERVTLIPDDEGTREGEPPMVQYLRFVLTEEQVARVRGGAELGVGVEHPNYQARVVLDGEVRANVAATLDGDRG